MSWLNIPVGIIERDVEVTESLYIVSPHAVAYPYERTTRWITTRYVGGNYQAAVTKRAALRAEYPGVGFLAPKLEAEIVAAGGGQYQVIATVKTLTDWTAVS